MRIDLTTYGAEPPEKNQAGRAGQTGSGATGASNASNNTSNNILNNSSEVDQTQFSFDQARVQTLATQVLAQPDVRDEKVQSLQQAIGNGEYSVSPAVIAEALAAEFGGAQG
jgi:flagellar biosynthesis anti-sigma factor FlgM